MNDRVLKAISSTNISLHDNVPSISANNVTGLVVVAAVVVVVLLWVKAEPLYPHHNYILR